jgi:hypothetical protein
MMMPPGLVLADHNRQAAGYHPSRDPGTCEHGGQLAQNRPGRGTCVQTAVNSMTQVGWRKYHPIFVIPPGIGFMPPSVAQPLDRFVRQQGGEFPR